MMVRGISKRLSSRPPAQPSAENLKLLGLGKTLLRLSRAFLHFDQDITTKSKNSSPQGASLNYPFWVAPEPS
jgi:hypothetical protein